ncbi:MAG: glutathione S-transferase [Lysobacterales bacterium]
MPNETLTLFIGAKNYSSWSMRPWLCLRWANIAVKEAHISLQQEGYGQGQIREILAVSPNGRVPALHAGDTTIWDSLAIAEWAAEQQPSLWPEDPMARAHARSATCEMHSGFPHLRDELPMNIDRRCKAGTLSDGAQRDVRRVLNLWSELRQQYSDQGPWLFGQRSIADAFYAPIVCRFRTYGIEVPEPAKQYYEALLADSDFKDWAGAPIDERFENIDSLYT